MGRHRRRAIGPQTAPRTRASEPRDSRISATTRRLGITREGLYSYRPGWRGRALRLVSLVQGSAEIASKLMVCKGSSAEGRGTGEAREVSPTAGDRAAIAGLDTQGRETQARVPAAIDYFPISLLTAFSC